MPKTLLISYVSLLVFCLELGCSRDTGDSTTSSVIPSGMGGSENPDPEGSTEDIESSSSMGGSEEEGSTGGSEDIKFDVLEGSPEGAEEGEEDSCQKVDILFVIDNSGSMADEQAALINSFQGFVSGIQSQLEDADSYHVGVVTSDSYGGNENGCQSIGSLVTQTSGEDSSNSVCSPFSSGKRFMDDTEPALSEKFACVAQVGSSGDGDERQAAALIEAISPQKGAQGECNEGFIREDALLVLVLITDEDDKEEECLPFFGCLPGGSPGSPAQWADAIYAAKDGVPSNVVLLSIIGTDGNTCGADGSGRLAALSNFFANSSIGDICAPSYTSFFTDAIAIIETACDEFVFPG